MNHKAPGEDCIITEFLKYGDNEVMKRINALLVQTGNKQDAVVVRVLCRNSQEPRRAGLRELQTHLPP